MTACPIEDQFVLEHLDEEWDVPCDIPGRRALSPGGWPECSDTEPARWIIWKGCPCNTGPQTMLVCDTAKACYEQWASAGAIFTCAWCGEEFLPGPGWITPLNGKA